MAIHLLPLAKLAFMAGKAGTSKTAGAAMVKQAASISARGPMPGWLVNGALAGLIGFKPPTQVGYTCKHCHHFINLNQISRGFNARLVDKEFMFNGKCPACSEIVSIPDSSLKSRQ